MQHAQRNCSISQTMRIIFSLYFRHRRAQALGPIHLLLIRPFSKFRVRICNTENADEIEKLRASGFFPWNWVVFGVFSSGQNFCFWSKLNFDIFLVVRLIEPDISRHTGKISSISPFGFERWSKHCSNPVLMPVLCPEHGKEWHCWIK